MRGKENKGELLIQVSIHDFDPKRVLHITHQPAKPVETNNTSHVFVAERIKPKPLNKNNPLNVEAAKNKANVPHSELKGSAPAHSVRI